MKLSEVRGERSYDVIADCIEPVANIALNPEAKELFSKKRLPEGMTPNEFMLRRVKKSVPVLLRDHKKDIVAIMSSIEGVSGEEYLSSLSLAKLIQDLVELVTDEVFLEFFISPQSEKEETSYGSASENTEEQEA